MEKEQIAETAQAVDLLLMTLEQQEGLLASAMSKDETYMLVVVRGNGIEMMKQFIAHLSQEGYLSGKIPLQASTKAN